MPASGEQHVNVGGRMITNPFDEVRPRISEYTAQEIATLQSRLEKQLGPEYISSRVGPSGQKIHYLAAEKCIQLANEVFGFNGWSSTIKELQVDFVDENPTSGKVSLGLSVVVRVTLRDGTFHEDIGYGHIENCKGKAAAFEKAKKEGTTDGLKRALRNFGNVLGNCIYDKEYLSKVTKVKVTPSKWDVEGLHRHADYHRPKKEESTTAAVQEAKYEPSSELISGGAIEDEFDDFDEADFGVGHDPDSHPDEVILPALTASHHFNAIQPNVGPQDQIRPSLISGPVLETLSKPQNDLQAPEFNGIRMNAPPQQQSIPQNNGGLVRTNSGAGSGVQARPPQDVNIVLKPQQPNYTPQPGPPRILNQPSRTGLSSTTTSPGKSSLLADMGDGFPAAREVEVPGFFSARGLNKDGLDIEGPVPLPVHELPIFNPNAESPSIRKTPGVDHSKTRPLNRELRHVPGSIQPNPVPAPTTRPNIINPQLDAARRIGAPGSPSPGGNRGMYKPPTMKRPSETPQRPPLGDLSLQANIRTPEIGGDVKRQRLNGL